MQTDETFDFIENQAEKSLLARTGRTRPIGKKNWIPTRKEWEKMNGPVIVKNPLPKLTSLRSRLLYLKGADTQEEFSKKCGVGLSTIGSWTGGRKTPSKQSLQIVANACNVPIAWLAGEEPEANTDTRAEVPVKRKESQSETNFTPGKEIENSRTGMALTICGKYRGADVMRYLSGLCENADYAVQISVSEA